MKFILGFKSLFLILILLRLQYSYAAIDQCLNCHQQLEDEPSRLFIQDVHFIAGLSCKSCHGGNEKSDDMELSMSKSEGFIGVPVLNNISEICSKCHSDNEYMNRYNSEISTTQLENIKTSIHGKLAVNGREMILQCTTCHNAHGIKRVNDPGSPVYPINIPKTCNKCHGNASYMQLYNPAIPVDQLTKYRTSVHGVLNSRGNIKVAECASCHGSHNILRANDVRSTVYKLNIPNTCSHCHSDEEYMKDFNIPTDQFIKFQNSVHGNAVFEKQDLSAPVCNDCHGNHGATPPGIESISKVCGNCHALNAELFSGSPHKSAFDKNNYPECETCHGNHEILIAEDKLIGVGENSVCLQCHSPEEYQKGYLIAKEMKQLIDSLIISDSVAKDLTFKAEQKGMDVEEIKFMLREIHQARLETRTIVHSFNEEKFKEVTAKGFKAAELVSADARSAIDEFYFRRYGLVMALVIISFLIVMLFFYIRKIEKN